MDTGTFVRFAKYAYSGDYTEADPDILTDVGLEAEDAEPEDAEAKVATAEDSDEAEDPAVIQY